MGSTPVYHGPSVLPIDSHFNVDEPFALLTDLGSSLDLAMALSSCRDPTCDSSAGSSSLSLAVRELRAFFFGHSP